MADLKRGWRIERNPDGSGRWVNTDDLDALVEEQSREVRHRREVQAAVLRGVEQEREYYRSLGFFGQVAYSFGWLIADLKARWRR